MLLVRKQKSCIEESPPSSESKEYSSSLVSFEDEFNLVTHPYVDLVRIETPGVLARRNSQKYLVPADLVETAFLAITIGL